MLGDSSLRFYCSCVLLVAASQGLAPAVWAQSSTAAELSAQSSLDQEITTAYLAAYQLCKESEKLAAKQNWRLAITRAQEAERALAEIVRDHPLWRKNLLAMRRKVNAEHLLKCRQMSKDSTVGNVRDPHSSSRLNIESTPLPQTNVEASTGASQRDVEVLPGVIENNKQLYNELMRSREELRRMAEAYRVLRDKNDKAMSDLTSAKYELEYHQKKYKTLQENIDKEREAGNEVVSALNKQLLDLEMKLRESELARENAEKRADRLHEELSSLQIEHERVLSERDTLTAENARLREIVELNTPEKIKSLLDQNISLNTQLEDAQKRIDDLSSQLSAQGDEHSILRQQLDAARGEEKRLTEEMTRIYDENRGYRRRISELNSMTQDLEQNLADQEANGTFDPAVEEENTLLRDIIAKQKRTIKSQQEARSLLIDTYKQLKNQDPAILSALQKLDEESSPDLTPTEEELMQALLSPEVTSAETGRAIRTGLELEALADGAAKAFAAQRYTAAEQLYRVLIEQRPDHLAALVNFGMILIHRNKDEEAITYLDRASRINPQLSLSRYMSATAAYRLNRMDESRVKFIQTLKLDPGNADAFFYLANIEALLGDHDLALSHLASALKLDPQLADAHYNMSRIYIELGNYADAARAYDRAIAAGSAPDTELEGYLRSHLGESDEVGEDLVATIDPEQVVEAFEQDAISARQDAFSQRRQNLQALIAEGAPMQELMDVVMMDVEAAPSPSPAGAGHELDASSFSSTSIKQKGKKKTRKLRIKTLDAPRLRLRGAPLPIENEEISKDGKEKEDKKAKK